jgi:hypothetical protein
MDRSDSNRCIEARVSVLNGCINTRTSLIKTFISTSIEVLNTSFKSKITPLNDGISVSCGIVCSIFDPTIIKFTNDKLVWLDEENMAGIIKYNTLKSLKEWTLEEIEIEELL